MQKFKQFVLDNKWTILIILGVIIVAALVTTLVAVLVGPSCNPQPTPPQNNPGGGVVFDPDAGDYKDPDDTSPQWPNVAIPGWAELVMPPNETEITVDFFNPEQNAGYYYMTFELHVINPETGEDELLYKSGLVEAGKHIQKITLTHGLPESEVPYLGYVFVQPYYADDPFTATPTNNAKTSIKITVVSGGK